MPDPRGPDIHCNFCFLNLAEYVIHVYSGIEPEYSDKVQLCRECLKDVRLKDSQRIYDANSHHRIDCY